MVQAALCDRNISDNSTCQTVILITKGDVRNFRAIGIVEVLWKIIMGLLNRSFKLLIGFHDVLYGLRAGRGTGTTSLEANLPQQLTDMREAVLHKIFLEPHNSYAALDRDKCLDILEGYRMVTRELQLL